MPPTNRRQVSKGTMNELQADLGCEFLLAPVLFCALISGGVQNFRGLEAARGQLGDELRVGGKKIVVAKLLRQDPFDAFERCWDGLSFQDGNGKEANFQLFWCA